MRILSKFLAFGFVLIQAACSVAPVTPPHAEAALEDLPTANIATVAPLAGWEHVQLPGKQPSAYATTRLDGREAMAVRAESSASLLRQTLRIEPHELGSVRFSWKVPELIANADLGLRDRADSPVRVILLFEGDRSQFTARNTAMSELSRALTGEPLPYATLMYVWCNSRADGSVIINPRSDRIRKLVVQSGRRNLNQWLDYERNVRADFERVFGEAPGALVGVAIMTDSDNTRSKTKAWYGPVQLDRLQLAKK